MTHWRALVYGLAIVANVYVFGFLAVQAAKDILVEFRYHPEQPEIFKVVWQYGIIAATPLVSLVALILKRKQPL